MRSFPLQRIFAATSVLFLAVLAVSPAKSALSSYRSVQRQYRKLGMARARSLKDARDYERRPIAIQQVWLRDFEGRVDRCTTCHLGVADTLMKGTAEPLRAHVQTAHTPDAFDRFGCTSCHGGQGPATSTEEAHGTAADAGPPMTPAAYLEAGCGRCHAAQAVSEAPILSRGRDLMDRSGCFACHAVRGHESFRSQAPPLATLSMKTGGTWLNLWLRGPRKVDPNATMPNFHLSDKEIEELSHYLFNQPVPWELARRIQSAGEEPAGNAANGKKLFSESRCISCHTVEGKGNGSAPELSKVASWATRGWLLAFLRDPQSFYPRTRMPRYHFSESESRDVVAYLEDELRDFDAPKDMLTPVRVNQTLAENGGKLFRVAGCFACHSEPSGSEEKFGPELNGIGDKKAASLDFGRRTDLDRTLPAWLAAKIDSPRSFAQGLRMPSYEFNGEDTRAVVTALLSVASQPVPESYRFAAPRAASLVPGGPVGALIDRYRCLSCHRIGEEGGDISTAPLTFEGSKVRRDWLIDYLTLSYSLRPILEERMPVLRMPREEAVQLADAFESFYLDPRILEDPFLGRPTSDADATEGQKLYAGLGCRGCHIVGSSGGYYGPPLTDTGKRLKSGWVFAWLKGPQRWRADVRCPNYGLTDTDALRLTAYLGTLRSEPASAASGAAR
ncbi:MAG TPA: c-type cytochrome [Thermoanaerobaculia bacterium]|nr:c-type cytochrome [Thermoanaerobaculia bacterium]